jgi:cupin fold WbuC family metalloprotein
MAIAGFSLTSPAVYETRADPAAVTQEQIVALIDAARTASAGRARLLLHRDRADAVQEMVIALPAHSCDHPHINDRSGKSFVALSGQFAVMHCSDDGSRIDPIVLSAGSWPGARLLHLRAPAWHTIIPLAGDTVFLETIAGPFTGNRFAAWFPSETDSQARTAFVERFRQIARQAARQLAAT